MIVIYNDDNDIIYQLIADRAYRTLNLEGNASVELEFVSKDEIQAINAKQRKIDTPTDVLSFPYLNEIMCFTKENYPFNFDAESKMVELGTVIICAEIAQQQAQEFGHSIMREKAYLFLHGLLHLLGYDHETQSGKEAMRQLEEQILESVNLPR